MSNNPPWKSQLGQLLYFIRLYIPTQESDFHHFVQQIYITVSSDRASRFMMKQQLPKVFKEGCSWTLTLRGIFWVWSNKIARLTDRELHFRMGINLEMIPSRFLVFYVSVSESSQNGSGECPYLLVHKKIRLNLTQHPKCGTLSWWNPGTLFYWPCLQSPQKPAWWISQ